MTFGTCFEIQVFVWVPDCDHILDLCQFVVLFPVSLPCVSRCLAFLVVMSDLHSI